MYSGGIVVSVILAGVQHPDLALGQSDADALADELPRHAVAVGVQLDAGAGVHPAGEFAHLQERRLGRSCAIAFRSSRSKRSSGVSAVVPCTRTSATSRIQRTRCACSSFSDAKRCPAMALRLTQPTPRSSLLLVRALYRAQARGVTPQ